MVRFVSRGAQRGIIHGFARPRAFRAASAFHAPRAHGISASGAVAVAGLGGLIAGKLYLLHKYEQWRNGSNVQNQPGWRNSRSFAALPKRKQREVIYGKRAQLKEFENITYGRGYQPRTARRRRFRFGF